MNKPSLKTVIENAPYFAPYSEAIKNILREPVNYHLAISVVKKISNDILDEIPSITTAKDFLRLQCGEGPFYQSVLESAVQEGLRQALMGRKKPRTFTLTVRVEKYEDYSKKIVWSENKKISDVFKTIERFIPFLSIKEGSSSNVLKVLYNYRVSSVKY